MKENVSIAFWQVVKERFPLAYQRFLLWFDEYKTNEHQKPIFANGVNYDDLPFEMQMGVITAYFYYSDPSSHDNMNDLKKESARKFLEIFAMNETGLKLDNLRHGC